MAAIGKSLINRLGALGGGCTFAAKLKKQKMMNQPMIVWCVIAGVLLFAFLFRAIERYHAECRRDDRKSNHLLEMGSEREIFYIPGDIEDDDFEDL